MTQSASVVTRERERDGRFSVRLDIDDAITERLVETGFLRSEELDDISAVTRALEYVIHLWGHPDDVSRVTGGVLGPDR